MQFIESKLRQAGGLSVEDAVNLIESVFRSLHICKRVSSPTVCEGVQLIREDRNDDRFAACLQVKARSSSSVCQAVGHPG